MEIKWYMIGVAIMFLAMFGALAIDSMAKSRCRIEAMHNHVSVEDIERLCK